MKSFNIVVFVLLVYLIFLTLLLSKYNFSFTSFAFFAEDILNQIFPNQSPKQVLPSGTIIFINVDGQDGQYYYLIARNLTPPSGENRDIQRQQRILYPFLAKVLALGQEALLPLSLLVINLLAICLGTLAFKNIFPKIGLTALLIFAFSPLYILGLQYNLTDPLALSLGVAGLLFYIKDKLKTSSLFLALGLLTRESAAIFWIPIILTEILARRFKKAFLYSFSILPFIIYQLILSWSFGKAGLSSSVSHNQLSLPFWGIFSALEKLQFATLADSFRSLSVILVLLIIIVSGLHVVSNLRKRHGVFEIGILVCLLFALVAGYPLWEVYGSAGRVFTVVTPFILVSHYQKKSVFSSTAVFILALLSISTFLRPFLISPLTQFYIVP